MGPVFAGCGAVTDAVLRAFIHETLLVELRRNERFISRLRGSGLGTPLSTEGVEARRIADGWIRDTETEIGEPLNPSIRGLVNRFVAKRWKGLVARFHGDQLAARQTLENLLNTKFNHVRMEG